MTEKSKRPSRRLRARSALSNGKLAAVVLAGIAVISARALYAKLTRRKEPSV